jgi:hypothetical protein
MQSEARGMAEMLNYLSKFVLQMLPTISATVIGAYIVATWINPKTPPEQAKVAARSQDQRTAKAATAPAPPAQEAVAPAEAKPAEGKADEAKSSEGKSAEAKPAEAAETPKPAKAAGAPDKIRIIPIVKQPAQTTETTVASTAPASAPEPAVAAEERKDANELARAAIQRLRGGAETARATDEPAKPVAPQVRTQQARVAPEQAQPPAAAVAPPLPPAVSIASPRIAAGENPDQAASPERMTPPAEIPPERNPLNLHASNRVAENPSIADDFLSATKSFFRAITPQ